MSGTVSVGQCTPQEAADGARHQPAAYDLPHWDLPHWVRRYVHSKGFKFGMYLSSGPKTCSLNTCSHSPDPECVVNRTATGWGSYSADGSVEAQDAAWIAKQGETTLEHQLSFDSVCTARCRRLKENACTGADYLKYDAVCGGDFGAPPLNASFGVLNWEQVVVSKMGTALNKTGRELPRFEWHTFFSILRLSLKQKPLKAFGFCQSAMFRADLVPVRQPVYLGPPRRRACGHAAVHHQECDGGRA